MFNIANDFFFGLGIYAAISLVSLCILFYVLKTYKKVNKPPILHTVILFINYTWLVISLVMAYYSLWISITTISFIYLISIAPLFTLFFISKYFHIKSKTRHYKNLYRYSVIYMFLIPLWVTALAVL